jgi:NAD(P)H dehydrogenase (quinone)
VKSARGLAQSKTLSRRSGSLVTPRQAEVSLPSWGRKVICGMKASDLMRLLFKPTIQMKNSSPFGRAVVCTLFCVTVVACPLAGQTGTGLASANESGAVRVLVAYYSLTGNTEKMAQGVVEGIQQRPGVTVSLKKVEEVRKEDLEKADGIILGCPTYCGTIPGQMKVAIDDWSWKLKVDFTDKVGGAFSTGGGQVGGKEFTVTSLLMFMLNNRMVVAGPLYRNDKTGSVWAEAGAAAMTGPLDPGVSESELDSARRLGERVAGLAARLKRTAAGPQEPK